MWKPIIPPSDLINRNPFIIAELILYMILINIIKSYRDVVAICDAELLGKYFEDEKYQLDVKKSFFSGEEVDEKRAIQIIQKMSKEDAIFNIVGEKSIQAALKAGIINQHGIKKIQGISYALVLM